MGEKISFFSGFLKSFSRRLLQSDGPMIFFLTSHIRACFSGTFLVAECCKETGPVTSQTLNRRLGMRLDALAATTSAAATEGQVLVGVGFLRGRRNTFWRNSCVYAIKACWKSSNSISSTQELIQTAWRYSNNSFLTNEKQSISQSNISLCLFSDLCCHPCPCRCRLGRPTRLCRPNLPRRSPPLQLRL